MYHIHYPKRSERIAHPKTAEDFVLQHFYPVYRGDQLVAYFIDSKAAQEYCAQFNYKIAWADPMSAYVLGDK